MCEGNDKCNHFLAVLQHQQSVFTSEDALIQVKITQFFPITSSHLSSFDLLTASFHSWAGGGVSRNLRLASGVLVFSPAVDLTAASQVAFILWRSVLHMTCLDKLQTHRSSAAILLFFHIISTSACVPKMRDHRVMTINLWFLKPTCKWSITMLISVVLCLSLCLCCLWMTLGDCRKVPWEHFPESYTDRHYAALFLLYLLSTWITGLIPQCSFIPAFFCFKI